MVLPHPSRLLENTADDDLRGRLLKSEVSSFLRGDSGGPASPKTIQYGGVQSGAFLVLSSGRRHERPGRVEERGDSPLRLLLRGKRHSRFN